jgi:hypothetical protein
MLVLKCSWIRSSSSSSSLCVITVSTVQLYTLRFVQCLYSKYSVQQNAEYDSYSVSFMSSNQQQYTCTLIVWLFDEFGKMCLLVPLYISVLPSLWNYWRISENIFISSYVSDSCNPLLISVLFKIYHYRRKLTMNNYMLPADFCRWIC